MTGKTVRYVISCSTTILIKDWECELQSVFFFQELLTFFPCIQISAIFGTFDEVYLLYASHNLTLYSRFISVGLYVNYILWFHLMPVFCTVRVRTCCIMQIYNATNIFQTSCIPNVGVLLNGPNYKQSGAGIFLGSSKRGSIFTTLTYHHEDSIRDSSKQCVLLLLLLLLWAHHHQKKK